MMVLGTDLVYIPRILKLCTTYRRRFLDRLFSAEELAYCEASCFLARNVNTVNTQRARIAAKRLAARIAVKEAAGKALGSGMNGLSWGQGIDWKDVTLQSGNNKPPTLILTGKALSLAQSKQLKYWLVSLSHDQDYSLATVVGNSH